MTRRAAAVAALLLFAAALALAVVLTLHDFPAGVPVVACVALATLAAWHGIIRHGMPRILGLAAAGALLVAALVLVAVNERVLVNLILVAGVALAVSAARYAFAAPVALPPATAPSRPVLFWNPRSGGGKATKFHLVDEAQARGIEPVELKPGDDLVELVDAAIEGGADGLAMAGGDGSQAIVARIAAQHGLAYACIPAGTRNHFALDLGVDRDDVVGALDAFVDGGERLVDLAEVNGRVFVNNVSLGLYAEAVQKPEYRDAKLRTLLDTLPDALGPGDDAGGALHWARPGGADDSGAAVLVSNNRYRLGRAIGSGTRPHLDAGVLGVAVLDAPGSGSILKGRRPWREWSTPSFVVESGEPVKAGIDGEAAVLEPPLTFAIRPRTLRVRVARQHPGASPSVAVPDGFKASASALMRLAAGRGSA